MAIVNEIKCARCDRKYSGVRSRCPYCGARRIGRGKYSQDSDNAKGKMLISVLIMAVFTVAAGVLLFTTPVDAVDPDNDPGSLLPDPDEIISVAPEPVETPEPTPEPTIMPLEVISVQVLWDGSPLRFGNEFSQGRYTDNSFSVNVEPPGIDVEVIIESSNEEIFTVEKVVGGRPNGFAVTGVATGSAILTVTAGNQSTSVTVRIT